MNKTHIRLLLDKEGIKVSTVRIGETAVSLGFGDNLERRYTDSEAKQIMDTIRGQWAEKQAAPPQQPPQDAPNPLPTDESRALAKHLVTQSSQALTSQIQSLATRMDENDLELARQLAHHVATRPQRFSILFAQQLQALMQPVEAEPPTFVDVELGAVDFPELNGGLKLAPHSVAGCLPL